MALITWQDSAVFRDSKGYQKTYRYWFTGDNSSASFFGDIQNVTQALAAAITGLTSAAMQRDFQGATHAQIPLTYGGTGDYSANFIQARYMFETDLGVRAVFGIGAPIVAQFDSDKTTVLNDGSQAAVVAYVAAIKTASVTVFVSTRAGDPYTKFVGGVLKIGKPPKRLNETIKSSHLVAGEGE